MSNSKEDYIREATEKTKQGLADLRQKQTAAALEDYQREQRLKREMQHARDLEELKNKHIKTPGDDRHPAETLWDHAMKVASGAINAGDVNSTHDFRSSMMALLAMYGKMVEAGSVSAEQTFGEFYERKLRDKYGIPLSEAWIGAKSAIRNAIRGNPDIDIPAFQHNLTFKDGKVEIADLVRKDGVPFSKENEINLAFKALVNAWMIENDYTPVGDGKFRHVDGAELTEEKFNELKPSLGEFLEKLENNDLAYEAYEPSSYSPS